MLVDRLGEAIPESRWSYLPLMIVAAARCGDLEDVDVVTDLWH